MEADRELNPETLQQEGKKSRLLWLAIFSVAMGFLEGAVVIYLRKIYYPQGFHFPLTTIEPAVAGVEFLREFATIMMLVAVGVIAGRTRMERFLFFIYCFGIWDIVYYLVLKLFLDWPASIMDWDILFLIPVPWVGPVLAPCIVSLTMIYTACLFITGHFSFKRFNLLMMISGCLVIILSFCMDYLNVIMRDGSACWMPGSEQALFAEINNYVPVHYSWSLFVVGEGLLLFSLMHARYWRK